MDKLEKAIKGFEKCLDKKTNCFCEDIGCPYADECWFSDKNLPTRPLMEDAIELLKKQQPNVMTNEEIEEAIDTVVWIESRLEFENAFENTSDNYALILFYSRPHKEIGVHFVTTDHGDYIRLPYEQNGKKWRAWSKRPTDEQRKAVPWKDGDGE